MSVTSAELWKLLQDSRLLSAADLEQMESVFSQARNSAGQTTAESLVALLLREDLLTRYQASQLLNGRAGPFIYGDYRVQDRLRGGRLNGLFRAAHGPTRFPVLLKFAPQRVVQDPRQWSVARQYHRATVALVHPNLQRVYALEDCAGHRFLVLEDLTGETLERPKAIGSRLPPAEASRIIQMVARGLSEIHGQRQTYGDVQPANLWQESTGNVKLLRDGVLPPVVPDFSRTDLPEAAVAQANYAAPELAHPGTSLSPLTDIYALGCTFYQLMTGEPPFPGGTARDKLERHATAPIAPLESLGVPASLARLVAFMMAKNPTIRTATAHDVVAQLAPFVESPASAILTPPWSSSRQAFEFAIAHPSAGPPAPPPILTNLPSRRTGPPAPPVPPPEPAASPTVTGVAASAPPTHQEAGPPPEITVAAATDRPRAALRTRRPRRAPRTRALTLSLLAGVLLTAAAAYVWWGPQVWSVLGGRRMPSTAAVDTQSERPPADTESTGLPGTSPTSTATGDSLFDVRADDGTLLWMTPTQSQSIQLSHVPPGTQLLLVARPHELTSSEPGQLLLRAIDLDLSEYRQQWEAAAGCSWQEIEQFVVSWRSAAGTPRRPTMVVYLREPRTEQQLIAAWGNPPAVPHEEAHYFTARGWSFYVPVADNKPTFIMGEEEAVREVIAMHDAPPVLRREMAQLLATSDAQHQITILGVPSYLYGELFQDGNNALPGDASRIRKALEWLLGDQFTACQLGVHFGDHAYLELRGYGRTAADSRMLAESLANRIREIPERIESHFQQVYPSPYWRQVALRVPEMIRFLADHTRVGVEDDQAIVNSVLPPVAAHNLVFAGNMLFAPDEPLAGDSAAPASLPPSPQTLEELIQTRISFRFALQSLEFAVRDLAAAVRESHPAIPFPFDIQILGNDLQLNGITRNQQITDFQAENKPLGEILTALVMRANPVTTVTEPSDANQKLVWVQGPDPADANRQILLITTRDGVKRRGDTLPAAFQPR